jgi:hypothetical protein
MKAANPRRRPGWNNPAHAGPDGYPKRKAIGASQANISRLKQFDSNLTLGALGKVARALGADRQIDLAPRTACA